jgi:hypothetical protein
MPYQHTGNGARPQEADGRGALGLDSSLSENSSRVHGACVRGLFQRDRVLGGVNGEKECRWGECARQ